MFRTLRKTLTVTLAMLCMTSALALAAAMSASEMAVSPSAFLGFTPMIQTWRVSGVVASFVIWSVTC